MTGVLGRPRRRRAPLVPDHLPVPSGGRGSSIERASPADLLALASDRSGSPAVVAAVILLGGRAVDLRTARATVAERILAIPRLRQRLVHTPVGCGRPVWIDDVRFDIDRHVRIATCPSPGDESALLEIAAEIVTHPLPTDRPLWAAHLVVGMRGERSALIFAFHHVLADGIGGLAILGRLVDGAPLVGATAPRRPPSRREVLVDAVRSRLRAIAQLDMGIRHLGWAARELAPNGISGAPRSSLNQPIGTARRLAVARVDLASVLRVAHAYGGTVNDVVLAAVTGALHDVLDHRGESVERVVVSIPVSGRREAGATDLGNDVGAMPVPLSWVADPFDRLRAITCATRVAKTSNPGASASLLGPGFRALAALGLLRWFLDRQRLITTFVTNVRGPADRLCFLGAPITGLIPVSPITGNVTVAFAALSYAVDLTVTVIADPQRCPDLPLLAVALQGELDAMTAIADSGAH